MSGTSESNQILGYWNGDGGQAVVHDVPSGHGISPIEYNCVVKPDEVEAKTKGGIYIPDEVRERDQFAATTGTLVAVSPMAFAFEDWPADQPKPQPGQRVAHVKYAGDLVKGADGADYRVMKDKDVLAVLT